MEGNETFTVTISEADATPLPEGVSIRGGTFSGAATLEGAGSDLASGEELTGTVVFGPNDKAVKTVSLATVDDGRMVLTPYSFRYPSLTSLPRGQESTSSVTPIALHFSYRITTLVTY